MAAAKLRKVGGSAMLAIPPDVLNTMNVQIGTVFDVTVKDGTLIATPAKRKYSLQQLLDEEQAAGIEPASEGDRAWLDAPAMGREAW